MPAARSILGLTSLVLVAGGIVMQFLVILSGLDVSPENQIYFLQAATTGISSNPVNPARWTWLRVCGVDASGHNANCYPTHAAVPFDPQRNFDATRGVPQTFLDHHNYYYYISRVSWAFYIIALFFAVLAFFLGLLAICTRLGAYLSSSLTFLAVGMQAVAASLMTAWVVQARNGFRASNLDASIGVKAMAFSWATFAAWSIAMILFCVGGTVGKSEGGYSSKKSSTSSYFGRKRSTRSRGSFRDSENGRRVKEDYE